MATNFKTCSIEGCKGNADWSSGGARGWCNAHYKRWRRHGSPLAGGTALGSVPRFYKEVVLHYDGDDCLTWPYCKDGKGYALADFDDKTRYVSRLVCEEVNGAPPTPEHEAAHSCGNGHLACVTKGHLSWKTPAENQADKLIHGTHNRGERQWGAKLTEEAVLAIRASTEPRRVLAARYGVARSYVWSIQQRECWAWLP